MTFQIRFNDDTQPPSDEGNGGLNIQVKEAIGMLVQRYRFYKHIPDWTVLTHEQINEIVFDIRDIVYEHEGIKKPKQ